MGPIIRANRRTLSLVGQWISEETYENSVYLYGLPPACKHRIDAPLPEEVTYSDAIAYLSRFLNKKIRYCELGVSVGKNFLQLANFLSMSELVGFDIEEVNPVLESFLSFRGRTEWETMAGSIKKGRSSLTEYEYQARQNRVRYLSGDIFDECSWEKLSGSRFNLIFSDAFHSPEAIIFEHEMIAKYELLDDGEFVLVWDDLAGGMEEAFQEIWSRMKGTYGLAEQSRVRIVLNGWVGLRTHQIGMILNTPKNSKRLRFSEPSHMPIGGTRTPENGALLRSPAPSPRSLSPEQGLD
jgi:hypothetical protein